MHSTKATSTANPAQAWTDRLRINQSRLVSAPMKATNLIPKISLLFVGLAVLYLVAWAMPARIFEPNTAGERTNLTAVVIQVVLPLSFLPVLFLGVWRACKASDYLWLAMQLLCFPSAYVYTLLVNRGIGSNS